MIRFIKKIFCIVMIAAMLLPVFSGCSSKDNADNKLLFNDGLISVCIDGKWGFINKDGKEVIKAQYDSVTAFSCGLAAVGIGGKFGYINTDGELVIPMEFDAAALFSEDIALVYVNKSYSYINKKGDLLFGRSFEYADNFYDGRALFSENEKYGYIDNKGEVVIKPQYKSASRFSEGLAPVVDEKSGLCGFINTKGKLVIDFLYTEAGAFKDGIARMGVDGSICYINKKGKLLLRTNMKSDSFSEGYARYTNDNDAFGFIDITGQTVIASTYSYAGSFSNGLAFACNDEGKVGYINTSGEYVIEPKYELFYSDKKVGFDFSDDGYVIVVKNKKFGVIDKKGNVILECKYDGLAGNSISKSED